MPDLEQACESSASEPTAQGRIESVYVFSDYEQACVKIGFSLEPNVRIKGVEAHHPRKLALPYSTKTQYARLVERTAHSMLCGKRVHGEWFRADVADAILAVKLSKRIVEDVFGDAQRIPDENDLELCLLSAILRRDQDDDPRVIRLVNSLDAKLEAERASK